MSYCLNPDCPNPENQKMLHPQRAKFCSNCGFPLLLSDRYRALSQIGQGDLGRTFVAVDEHKPSKPRCIIKQLVDHREKPFSPDESTQFRQEAERLEKLGQHGQIPALMAFFEQGNHRYLIQEFIDGVSLETQLEQQGAFDELQIRHILNEILPVLQYVHIHQIIHRDIKAKNLIRLVNPSPEREAGVLFLVDFGTAKFATATNLLQLGTKISGQGYGPPEQAAGRATFSSDLYGLGVTCIHLLTQKPLSMLFNRDQYRWVWEPHLKQSVSEGLTAILNKMTKQELRNRYKAANEVLEDLNRSASGISDRPTFVPPPTARSTPATFDSAQPAPAPQRGSEPAWECAHVLRGHQAWVRSVALSPDGHLLVSGSGDKTIKIWSVPRGQLLHTCSGHSTWVRDVAISPDQRLVASVSNDKTIRLWHLQSGSHQKTLTGHTDWIRAVVFMPDIPVLVTAGQDKLIHLWDWKRGQILRTLKGHDHWVLSLAVRPDGTRIYSGSRDRTIRCWSPRSGTCKQVLLGHTSEVTALAISPDGTRLASGSADQSLRLWDAESGTLLNTLLGHGGAVNSVAFSPDGRILASGSSDKTVKLWNPDTGTATTTLSGHVGWVWSVSFPGYSGSLINPSEVAPPLASGSWDGTVHLWHPVV